MGLEAGNVEWKQLGRNFRIWLTAGRLITWFANVLYLPHPHFASRWTFRVLLLLHKLKVESLNAAWDPGRIPLAPVQWCPHTYLPLHFSVHSLHKLFLHRPFMREIALLHFLPPRFQISSHIHTLLLLGLVHQAPS